MLYVSNVKRLNSEQRKHFTQNQQKLMSHLHTYNLFQYLASGVEHGPSQVSELGQDDKEMCDFLGV